MARLKEQFWVAKLDMTLAGRKVTKGQIVQPCGSANDHVIFGNNTRWTYRYDGGEQLTCGTDGCDAAFVSIGLLDRHREIVHKPERDAREKARLAEIRHAKEAEERGETIGGREIVTTKRGPRGDVPYISPTG